MYRDDSPEHDPFFSTKGGGNKPKNNNNQDLKSRLYDKGFK